VKPKKLRRSEGNKQKLMVTRGGVLPKPKIRKGKKR